MSPEVEGWVRDRLTVRSLTFLRSRPWADVWRVEAADGVWWLKVNHGATTYEPRLLAQLSSLGSALLPECIVHPDQPWSLIAHAGVPLPDLDPAPELTAQVDVWCDLLAGYAELQQVYGAQPSAGIGLPDFGPDRLLERFDEVLAAGVWFRAPAAPGLTATQLGDMRCSRPALAEAARRLESSRPATVQHDDLHQHNVLVDPAVGLARPRIIDWGDAVLAHPFGTLLVTLRSLSAGWSLHARDPLLRRVVDAYLEPWCIHGESRAELLDEVDLAVRTAGLARAAGWLRALGTPEAAAQLDMADGPSSWMLRLAEALTAPDLSTILTP